MTGSVWILRTLLSHWSRHRMQLATLLIGLLSATALWTGVQAINQQAKASYDRAASAFGGAATAMLVPNDEAVVPQSLFAALRRAGWPVSPMIEGRVRVGQRSIRLVGIEPISLPRAAGPAQAFAGGLSDARMQAFFSAEGRALIAPSTAQENGWRDGETLTSESGAKLPPLQIAPELTPDILVTDIGLAQTVLRQPDQVSRFLIDPSSLGSRAPLEQIAGTRLRLAEAGSESDLQRLTSSFHLNLTAFGLLSFLVGLFIVHSAIGLAFEQRLPMLRTLRACGVSAARLAWVLLCELILLSLIAGVAGLACGYVIAAALLPDVAASLRGLYGASVPGELAIAPQWWVAGLAMCVAGSLVAAASAFVRVLRLPLLVSAQPQAWQAAQRRWLTGQSGLALVALFVSLAAYVFGTSVIAAFAVLGGALLAAALLLPVLLSLILRTGQSTARGAIASWVWADSRQQLSGLSLALMALLLALAVNIGVGTMVGSFSQTFLRWIDGRLAADIYVSAQNPKQAAELEAWLRRRDDVQAVLPAARADIRIASEPVELFGLADHATYRDLWPLLQSRERVWDDVRDGRSVLVSEQLARRQNLKLGDRIALATPSGPWDVTIGAIYADYGNPKGQVTVNTDQLLKRFPDLPRTRFGLRAAPQDVPRLMTDIAATFSLGDRDLADQATIKTESRRIFNRTFAVTSVLNGFTLGVAGVALLTSLLTLGQSRLPQLAPLWALGLTRRRLASLEWLKTMLLALITVLLALPLGLAVAWCLIAVVNVKAFGWRLPMAVFPADLARLVAVAMLAACVASLIPIVRLARMQPVTLLRLFADEQ